MSGAGFRGRTVLVTGGAGFIGGHLVDTLLAQGAAVRVLDDFSTGLRSTLDRVAEDIELFEGDLRDADLCARACDGAEIVFHQAALGSVPRSMKDPGTSIDVNVTGTGRLFSAARDAGARRVVFASSSSVYGDGQGMPKREGEEGRPLSPYALSKAMCEELADVFGRCFDLEIIGLRYFNVFGPRQRPDGPYAAVVPRFCDAYRRGVAPVIYGDGEQSRDFTFVADAVAANLAAAVAPAAACGRAYNVGGGATTSVNRLAELIRERMGGGPDPVHEPPRAGDVRRSLADLAAIGEATGFRPSHTIETGLDAAVEHYLAAEASEPASA